MQIYGIYISICCKSLCFGNKHYICIIYGSWALLMSPLKGKLMDCKRMKLDSFPWDSRSVDKTSKCEGKKLDKFFFPKVECTATAVLCCSLTVVPAFLSSLDKKPLYGSIWGPCG